MILIKYFILNLIILINILLIPKYLDIYFIGKLGKSLDFP